MPGVDELYLVRRKGPPAAGPVPPEALELVGKQFLPQCPAQLRLEAYGRDLPVAEDQSPDTKGYRSDSDISTNPSIIQGLWLVRRLNIGITGLTSLYHNHKSMTGSILNNQALRLASWIGQLTVLKDQERPNGE